MVGYKVYWEPVSGLSDPDYESEFIIMDETTTSVLLPDDTPNLPANGVVKMGIASVDDVGNESDIIMLPTISLDSMPPAPPSNIVIKTVGV